MLARRDGQIPTEITDFDTLFDSIDDLSNALLLTLVHPPDRIAGTRTPPRVNAVEVVSVR